MTVYWADGLMATTTRYNGANFACRPLFVDGVRAATWQAAPWYSSSGERCGRKHVALVADYLLNNTRNTLTRARTHGRKTQWLRATGRQIIFAGTIEKQEQQYYYIIYIFAQFRRRRRRHRRRRDICLSPPFPSPTTPHPHSAKPPQPTTPSKARRGHWALPINVNNDGMPTALRHSYHPWVYEKNKNPGDNNNKTSTSQVYHIRKTRFFVLNSYEHWLNINFLYLINGTSKSCVPRLLFTAVLCTYKILWNAFRL